MQQQATKFNELRRVYPIGYSNNGAFVEQLMKDSNVLLIDTRAKPWPKMEQWRQGALQEKYQERYRYAGLTLGNENYNNGGSIKIANIEVGIKGLLYYLNKGHDLIMLCGCAVLENCHVKVLLDALDQEIEVNVVKPSQLKSTLHVCVRGETHYKPPDRADSIKAISIRPPYATWIANPQKLIDAGLPPKTIENRSRDFTGGYRGRVLLHQSRTFEDDAMPYWNYRFPGLDNVFSSNKDDYPKGFIVGEAELTNVIDDSDDPWFVGEYGFVLVNARPITPIAYPGSLGLFSIPSHVLERKEDDAFAKWLVKSREETAKLASRPIRPSKTDIGSKVYAELNKGNKVPAIVLETAFSPNGNYLQCRLKVAQYNAMADQWMTSMFPKPVQSCKLTKRSEVIPGLDDDIQC